MSHTTDLALDGPVSASSQIYLAGGLSLVIFTAALIWGFEMAVVLAALPLGLLILSETPLAICGVFMCLSYFRLTEAYQALHAVPLIFVTGLMSLAAVVWHGVLARTMRIYWTPELVMMVALFALILGTTASCPQALDSGVFSEFNCAKSMADIWSGFAKAIATCLALAWFARSLKDFRLLAFLFLASGTLISLIGFYLYVGRVGLVEGTRLTIARHLNSPLGDPNDLALILLFPFGLALSILRYRPDRLITWFSALTASTTFGIILLTRSRGALLGVMVVVAIIGARMVRSKLLVAMVSVALGAMVFVAMGIADRESGGDAGYVEGKLDESSAHRLIAWRAAINMALARPLSGVGIGNFKDAFFLYTPEPIGRAIVAHSSWFGMLGEGGFPGLLAFVLMLGFSVRSAGRALKMLEASQAPALMRGFALGCLTGICGFCVCATFLSQHFGWPGYILTALTAAVLRFAIEHQARVART